MILLVLGATAATRDVAVMWTILHIVGTKLSYFFTLQTFLFDFVKLSTKVCIYIYFFFGYKS